MLCYMSVTDTAHHHAMYEAMVDELALHNVHATMAQTMPWAILQADLCTTMHHALVPVHWSALTGARMCMQTEQEMRKPCESQSSWSCGSGRRAGPAVLQRSTRLCHTSVPALRIHNQVLMLASLFVNVRLHHMKMMSLSQPREDWLPAPPR